MKLTTPLVPIVVPSIYNHGPLPSRLAKCTPDTATALQGVIADLAALGFELRLSDLFRSSEMQRQAHDDYVGVPLAQFWEIARGRGFFPIIDAPIASRSEAWHFDRRGSHDLVYQYVREGRAGASIPPYTQMAVSGILALGVTVDTVPSQDVAFQQSALVRLELSPGRIDGVLGDRTRGALRDAGVDATDPDPIGSLCRQLHEKFPDEF